VPVKVRPDKIHEGGGLGGGGGGGVGVDREKPEERMKTIAFNTAGGGKFCIQRHWGIPPGVNMKESLCTTTEEIMRSGRLPNGGISGIHTKRNHRQDKKLVRKGPKRLTTQKSESGRNYSGEGKSPITT